MPSPFPGMDPYLEAHWLWPDVHNSLIGAIRYALAPQVAPAYYVAIEERTYVVPAEPEASPRRADVALVASGSREPASGSVATAASVETRTVVLPRHDRVREAYLQVREVGTHAVVTVIEVLSPTNKVGYGRVDYVTKRAEVLDSATSLVEIDLLRIGEPMEMSPRPTEPYRILVAPGWARPDARLWAFDLQRLLPNIPVPLREREQEPVLPLGELLAEVYDRARYDLRLDYAQAPPEPPLSSPDAEWVALVLQQGSRGAAQPAPRAAALHPDAGASTGPDDTRGEKEGG